MGIWGNPAATKKIFLLILGVAPAPGAPPPLPPAYATALLLRVPRQHLEPYGISRS